MSNVIKQQISSLYYKKLRNQLLGDFEPTTTNNSGQRHFEMLVNLRRTLQLYIEPNNDHSMSKLVWNMTTAVLETPQKFQLEFSGLQPELKQEILLELILNMHDLNEQIERLSTFIIVHPYINNPVLVGLMGILNFKMYLMSGMDYNYNNAVKYLFSSVELEPMPLHYVSCYELLKLKHDTKKIQVLLSRLDCLDDIFTIKLKIDYYQNIDNCPKKQIDHSVRLQELDPMCSIDVVHQLINCTHVSREHKVVILANRLDYDRFDANLWNMLLENMQNDDIWQDRKLWWPDFHQFGTGDLQFNHLLWAKLVGLDLSLFDVDEIELTTKQQELLDLHGITDIYSN